MTLKFRVPFILGCMLLLGCGFLMTTAWAAAAKTVGGKAAYQVDGIQSRTGEDGHVVEISGSVPPTYTVYELFDPLRIVLDIADASFAPAVQLPIEVNQGPVTRITGKMLEEKEPFIAKVEVYLKEDRTYTTERVDNKIVVKFANDVPPASRPASEPSASPSKKEEGGAAASAGEKNRLHDIRVDPTETMTYVVLKAAKPIKDYSKVNLKKGSGRPDRMYIDIPNLEATTLGPEMKVGGRSALAGIRTSRQNDGVRIVFDSNLDTLFDYDIASSPEGLMVAIRNPVLPAAEKDATPKAAPATPETAPGTSSPDPLAELLAGMGKTPEKKGDGPTSREKLPSRTGGSRDNFSDAGFNKNRISVDFYKIDLHNVFRLFGEISGANIIVDEGVSGTLTLALNDVPWDFALDIILNLKGLQKEERFNTIVISSKSKQFTWPQEPEKELEIKAPPAEIEVAISQKVDLPAAILEAKALLHQASILEQQGGRPRALELYEKSFDKWPENLDLARKIASLCLVELGMNAKAVHYAKIILQKQPEDAEAALQAAIGLANMQSREAGHYFEIASRGDRPARDALLSHAAYAEETGDLTKAMALLAKFVGLYGDSIDSMIARARIHDKNGQEREATEQYRAILYSGYPLEPDLANYARSRAGEARGQ